MNITGIGCGVLAAAMLSAAGNSMAADAKDRNAKIEAADCAGFTAKDVAPFLGAPAAAVTRKIEKLTKTLFVCSYALGNAAPGVAFSIEIAPTVKKATDAMERYRDNLSLAGEAAPWKGKLPKGAYSDIMGPGLGDEALWTDINGALTLRKANVTVQVSLPKAKLDQIKLAQAVLAKF